MRDKMFGAIVFSLLFVGVWVILWSIGSPLDEDFRWDKW